MSAAALPAEVHTWLQQVGTAADRSCALCLFGPTQTGKTHLARQFGPHMYFRGSVNWDRWEQNVDAARYIIFDDVDWRIYSRDVLKAILSGQQTFDKCTGDAYMRTIRHGRPVVVILNNDTSEEQQRIVDWQADAWTAANMFFCHVPSPLF